MYDAVIWCNDNLESVMLRARSAFANKRVLYKGDGLKVLTLDQLEISSEEMKHIDSKTQLLFCSHGDKSIDGAKVIYFFQEETYPFGLVEVSSFDLLLKIMGSISHAIDKNDTHLTNGIALHISSCYAGKIAHDLSGDISLQKALPQKARGSTLSIYAGDDQVTLDTISDIFDVIARYVCDGTISSRFQLAQNITTQVSCPMSIVQAPIKQWRDGCAILHWDEVDALTQDAINNQWNIDRVALEKYFMIHMNDKVVLHDMPAIKDMPATLARYTISSLWSIKVCKKISGVEIIPLEKELYLPAAQVVWTHRIYSKDNNLACLDKLLCRLLKECDSSMNVSVAQLGKFTKIASEETLRDVLFKCTIISHETINENLVNLISKIDISKLPFVLRACNIQALVEKQLMDLSFFTTLSKLCQDAQYKEVVETVLNICSHKKIESNFSDLLDLILNADPSIVPFILKASDMQALVQNQDMNSGFFTTLSKLWSAKEGYEAIAHTILEMLPEKSIAINFQQFFMCCNNITSPLLEAILNKCNITLNGAEDVFSLLRDCKNQSNLELIFAALSKDFTQEILVELRKMHDLMSQEDTSMKEMLKVFVESVEECQYNQDMASHSVVVRESATLFDNVVAE